jgi:hypothetical protein
MTKIVGYQPVNASTIAIVRISQPKCFARVATALLACPHWVIRFQC